MRTIPLLAGLSLAFALVTFAPTGAASNGCNEIKSDPCPGLVCSDVNGDGHYGTLECVPATIDRCEFQSDCCPNQPGSGVWCPEYEDS